MFKNIKVRFIVILSSFLLVMSCLKEEGNYDYNEINTVRIEGLEKNYSVTRFDNFNILPRLNDTLGPDNLKGYAYRWQAIPTDGRGEFIELSNEKDLLVPIQLYPGGYNVYYTVRDLDTDVEFQTTFKLEVINSIYEGWMVLNEVDGDARLDMVTKIYDEYIVKHDILNIAGSELVLEGIPGFVCCYKMFDFYGIYISTSGNGTVRIEENTFAWNEGYNLSYEFLGKQPVDLEVGELYSPGDGDAYAFLEGNIYRTSIVNQVKYSVPINSIDGVVLEVSPYVGLGKLSLNRTLILYDIMNKRFLRTRRGRTYKMPEGNLFDYNTGKDLVFMTGSRYLESEGAEIFTILNDPDDGKNYLAIFNSEKMHQSYYDEIIAKDFDQATCYAVDPVHGYLFYAVGGKIYQYDFSLRTTKLMLDKGAEEISLIKFHCFFSKKYHTDFGNKLIVCSYNPSGIEGSNGTMELYSVPQLNGQIELVSSYTGFGKIKSVSYRER